MYAERKSVTITTDASGDGTGYIPVDHGRVFSIAYTKVDFADGVDFTITAEATGEAVLSLTDANASVIKYPRAAAHDVTGATLVYAASGSPVDEPIWLADDRIKIVVAQGGDTKTGTFSAVLG